jgi:hypothetical protein
MYEKIKDMKKIFIKMAAVLLILVEIFSCGKEDSDMNTVEVKGTIEGYHKCTDFENGGIVFGIYIITDQNDTLLSYNVPHETLCSLFGVASLENLRQDGISTNYMGLSPIIFDYREAKKHETVTIFCPQDAMWPAFTGRDDVKQIIINNIKKDDIK